LRLRRRFSERDLWPELGTKGMDVIVIEGGAAAPVVSAEVAIEA